MAANGFTPIQHFRSRTTTVSPGEITTPSTAAAMMGQNTIQVAASVLPPAPANILYWAIDLPVAFIPYGTTVTNVTVNGGTATITCSNNFTATMPLGQSVRVQQLREGELFINTADNRLAVGAYPQTPTGNSDVLGIVDIVPSIKAKAGQVLRVSDDGLTINWSNVTGALGAVENVWAGFRVDPYDNTPTQSAGIVTSPATDNTTAATQIAGVTLGTIAQTTGNTFTITVTAGIASLFNGYVIGSSVAGITSGQVAFITAVSVTPAVITVRSYSTTTTPWGPAGTANPNIVFLDPRSSSGIQLKGFVATDSTVVPYMAPQNRNTAPFATTQMYSNVTGQDTGITNKTVNATPRVVDPTQGGFGINLQSRSDLTNAAAPIQMTDTGTYTAKTYGAWTTAGFTAYMDTTFYTRQNGLDGSWSAWMSSSSNRKLLVSDGVNTQWQPLPQPIQNVFFRTYNNTSRYTNRGLFVGSDSWLGLAQNQPDATTGMAPSPTTSVRPDNQDLILDIVQKAAMPIAAGGTGIDLRDSANTYWSVSNNRLNDSTAWAIPQYGTDYQGPMRLISAPFGLIPNAISDPSPMASYVLTYKGVQQVPTWVDNLQGIQLQGVQPTATNTFNNSNRPLRLEQFGRFGVWSSATGGVSSYTPYAADGTIQALTNVTGQNLTIKGSTAAADSRLVLQQVTTPTDVGNGLVNVRIDSGVLNVNDRVGSSLNQIAEDFTSVTLAGTAPSFTVSNDFLSGTVTYVSGTLVAAGQTSLNLVLDHTGQALTSFCGGQNRTVSGLIIFQTAAGESISKLSINITAPNLGSVVTRVLRPLAGIVVGQYVVISWVATGTVALITVAAGD